MSENAVAPKVAVIVPVYNTARYLPACLDSVLSQSLSDLEIIAVNDASTDDSPRILAEYAGVRHFLETVSRPFEPWIRWTVTDANPEAGWSANAVPVLTGNVDQLVLSRTLNIGYFSIGPKLYKISNLMAANPTAYDISASNSAFNAPNTGLKLALAPSNNQYLYVMVINEDGESENVYLTTNGQAWTTLTTETIRPIAGLHHHVFAFLYVVNV